MHSADFATPLSEADGPFTYSYLAAFRVPGMRLQSANGRMLTVWASEGSASEAFLTTNWDDYCADLDTSAALSVLLLTSFRGQSKFRKLGVAWNSLKVAAFGRTRLFRMTLEREEKRARAVRHKEHATSGCYLVYRAHGDVLADVNWRSARRYGKIGTGFDMVDGRAYRNRHRPEVNACATSVALALAETTGSPEVQWINDVIVLNGTHGLTVYPKAFTMGTPTLTVTTGVETATIARAAKLIPPMRHDHRIQASVSLFVQSQAVKDDNLRAFIAAWSALELLINYLAKQLRPQWEASLQTGSHPTWDKDLMNIAYEDYRMRDSFFAVSCVLDLPNAASDSLMFATINKKRSGYYHQLASDERELPTQNAYDLFRKYLRLGLQRPESRGGTT